MLLKSIGAVAICVGGWYIGECRATVYNERIFLIEDYIKLLQSLKSAISFSGMPLEKFFKKNTGKYTCNFCDFFLKNKNNFAQEFLNYKSLNQEEEECVRILTETLKIAEASSDIAAIEDSIEDAVLKLSLYKKQIKEEYCSKIKTLPELGLIAGLFVAVLIL